VLALRGPHTPHDDRRILAAFVAQLALAVQRQALEAEAAHAVVLAEGNRVRTALLSAVSHDLRTPLATIKAWLTGLLEGDVTFSPEVTTEILGAAVGEVDRLNNLVGNLLDMSRLQTGGVQVHTQPVALDAVTSAAVATLPHGDHRLRVTIPDSLPEVDTDAALLERVVANLVDNALRHTPRHTPVELRADSGVSGGVTLRIIDHGAGVVAHGDDWLFEPFQRLGDQHDDGGVGLGLAVAKGLTEAIKVDLEVQSTPGGGTTMLLTLPTSP
jgi:two-component system, OmpR family, sensor histidine kinase KdpD